jgi:hypothetical protein
MRVGRALGQAGCQIGVLGFQLMDTLPQALDLSQQAMN